MKRHTITIPSFTSVLLILFLSCNTAKCATNDFNSRAAGNWNAIATWSKQLTGTVAFVNGNAAVVGTSTLFATELVAGDILMLQATTGTIRGTVSAITDATHLTLVANATANASGAYSKEAVPTYLNGVITISHAINVNINVTVDQVTSTSGSSLTIDAGKTLTIADGSGTDFTETNTAVIVNGTIIINNGALALGGGGNGSTSGSITVNSGGTITLNGTISGNSTVNWSTTINSGGSMSISATGIFSIAKGSSLVALSISGTVTVKGGGTIAVPTAAILDVNNGGTINLDESSFVSGNAFNLKSGGNIEIGSPDGITSSGATGNVQTSSRTYNAGANYSFDGNTAQVTGNSLPTTITGNVTISNPEGVTLSPSSITLNGSLTITNGWFDIRSKTLTLGGGPNSFVGSGSPASGSFKGNSSSVLIINGTGALGSAITFNNDFATEIFLSTFTLNRSSSGAATLNSDLKIGTGGLTLTNGVLTIAAGRKLDVQSAATTLGTAECLVLNSDATSTASFIDNGSISGAGTAKIQRYLTKYDVQATPEDWKFHFLSSPVGSAQAIMPEFQTMTNTTNDFYMWDEPTGYWINTKLGSNSPFTWNTAFGSGNGSFVPGKGYLVAYPADIIKNFVGKPYTSSGGLTMACTNTSGGGWNLLGNPFPSAIDWDAVAKGGGMDGALYYYDNSAPRYRYYVSLTGGIGTSYSGGARYIPSMQGFMVHAKTSGTKTITMDNGDRVHQNLGLYYKDAIITENVLNIWVEGNNSRDDARICFYELATENFDGNYDAYKIFSYNTTIPELYSITPDNTDVSINTLPLSQMYGTVQLGFLPGSDGTFTFNAEGINNFAPEVYIKLEDRKTGNIQKLNNNPVYTFTSATGDVTGRFLIHFQDATAINDPVADKDFTVYSDGNIINMLAMGQEIGQVKVYDIAGREIASATMVPDKTTRIDMIGHTGIYVVSVLSNKGISNTKVVIK